MEILIKKISHNSFHYKQTCILRDLVLRKPLGLSFTPEELEQEFKEIHLAAFLEGQIRACLVLKPISKTQVKMRQVAVDPHFQNQGLGKKIVVASEEVSKKCGFQEIELHARLSAVGFYLKLNYSSEGDIFEEVNIPHQKMKKKLNTQSSP